MSVPISLWAGLGLSVAGWLAARAVARAWDFRNPLAGALDAAAPLGIFALVLASTARPLFAGAVSLALFGGFAFADMVKRLVLREPVVFSDMSEAVEIFRHPQFYLPFAGTGRVIAGAVLALAAFIALPLWEPPLWPSRPWRALAGLIALLLLILALAGPLIGPLARLVRRLGAVGDPFIDSAAIGPFAMQLAYGAVARHERPARRAALGAPAAPAVLASRSGLAPVVLVQCESFFDARRLDPAIPAGLLPAFDRACRESLQWGRLAVPTWGANTTRTEFQALTGATDADIGFDRFNPYHAFARAPVASLAWRLKQRGYRAVCVHPFDPTFYDRRTIMPRLGFDALLGEEAFANAERGESGYIADRAVAEHFAERLREEGEGLFLFAITMQNHGPWGPLGGADDLAPGLGDDPVFEPLRGYLRGLRDGDAMLGALMDALTARGDDGVLGFYGDHLPGLEPAFARLGFAETASDYVLWRPRGGPGARKDIAAHELGARIAAETGDDALN